jgi:hypothetical protein
MWRKSFILIIFVFQITACGITLPSPDDFTLEDEIPCDSNALIDAINFANNTPNTTDTINLELVCQYVLTDVDNTVTPDGNNGLPSIISPIIINGNAATIARSSAAGTPEFRIFHIEEEGNLTLNNVNITNGNLDTGDHFRWTSGGAIFNRGSLTITDSTFYENSTLQAGGAIINYETSALLIITDTDFNANHAGVKGGAIFNEDGEVSVSNSTFSSNDARSGGAIFNDAVFTVNNSIFTGNQAERGGAIKNFIGNLVITGSTIENNQADYGGGIHNSTSGSPNELSISNTTIALNTADSGSGIENQIAGVVYLTNSTISGNSSTVPNSGYVIHNQGFIDISHSTIANNHSNGLYSFFRVDITNSIIANSPNLDCSIINYNGLNIYGSNLDSDGSCQGFTNTADPLLGPLADNGGQTMTHALLTNSLAIGAGTGTCLSTDQRDVGRPSTNCDLGAYEDTTLVAELLPLTIIGTPYPTDTPTPEPIVFDRCAMFDPAAIQISMLNIPPGTTTQTLYLNIPGGVPGLEFEVPEDPNPWLYRATLGSAEEEECTFEGYDQRLYCTFILPESALGTYQELLVYVNECDTPFYSHPRVTIFDPEPALVCTATLNESECIAAGGEYKDKTVARTPFCDCP